LVSFKISKYRDRIQKALTVNPQSWKYNHYVESNVGLGAGENDKLIEALQGIYGIQQQLKATGSLLVDDDKLYSTLNRITDGLGLPRTSEFFNDPSEPDDLLKAQNEMLNGMVVQLQEQLQMMQNPLAEAEQIKQQAFLTKAQSDAQIKVAELQSKNEQFQHKMVADNKKQIEDLTLKLTELELKYSKDVPGALV
jgi:hypothetical protein